MHASMVVVGIMSMLMDSKRYKLNQTVAHMHLQGRRTLCAYRTSAPAEASLLAAGNFKRQGCQALSSSLTAAS
jgi:hypothetical protein